MMSIIQDVNRQLMISNKLVQFTILLSLISLFDDHGRTRAYEAHQLQSVLTQLIVIAPIVQVTQAQYSTPS